MVAPVNGRAVAVLAAAAVIGCGGLLGEDVFASYEAARAAALADPGPPRPGWSGDAAVTLSHGMISLAISGALAGFRPAPYQADTPLGAMTLTPSLSVYELTASAAPCDGCVDLAVRARGEARWSIGRIGGTVPYTASTTARAVVVVAPDGPMRHLDADLTRIFRTTITAGDAKGLKIDIAPAIESWLTSAVVEQVSPVRVLSLDTDALPVRDVRLAASDQGMTLFLLSDAPVDAPLADPPSPPPNGFAAAISEDALAALARKQAFATITDVVPEVRSVSLDERGGFVLDLKLWSVAPPAFWRVYEARGRVVLEGADLQVVTDDVRAGDGSVGAEVVDVAAAMLGTNLNALLRDALTASVPLPEQRALGLTTRVDSVSGGPSMVLVKGTVTRPVSDPPRKR